MQAALGPGVSVFLSDVETDLWTESHFREVVDGSDRLIVTRGDKGAVEYRQNGTWSIPVEKVNLSYHHCLVMGFLVHVAILWAVM